MKSRAILMASAVGAEAIISLGAAKADSVSDLRAELKDVIARISRMEAGSPKSFHHKVSDLDQLKHQIADINFRLSRIAAAAPAPVREASSPGVVQPAVTTGAALPAIPPTAGNQTLALLAYEQTISAEPKPLVGGIPILRTPGGSFFISGTFDAGVRYDSGGGKNDVSVQSGLIRASRLTLEGYQNLGNGLRVSGVLEGGINLATGGGASNSANVTGGAYAWGRTAAVALGGDDYGYISFGRQYTPLWATTASPVADPYGGMYLGGAPFYNPSIARAQVRANASIAYSYNYSWEAMLDPAPRVGLGFAALFAPGGGGGYTSPSDSGQQASAMISYGTPDWWIGAGWDQVKGYNAAYTSALTFYTPTVDNTPVLNTFAAAASYDFKLFRLFGEASSSYNGVHQPVSAGGVNTIAWDVGLLVPFSAYNQNIRLMYGASYDRTSTNGHFSALQAAWEYYFITVIGGATLYVAGGVIFNNRNSAYAFGGAVNTASTGLLTSNGLTPDYGGTASSIASGIRWIF